VPPVVLLGVPVVELGATVPVVDGVGVDGVVETGFDFCFLGVTFSAGTAATDSTVGTEGALVFTCTTVTLLDEPEERVARPIPKAMPNATTSATATSAP
jgi:hypothetical protein